MEKRVCPKCESENHIKRGIVKNRQRYMCKGCGYLYTVNKIGKQLEKQYVIRSLQLYLEGLGFRSIERIMGVSHVSVINWVKKYGKNVEVLRKEDKPGVEVEVDELYSYIGTKKTKYGSGLLLTGNVKGYWVLSQETAQPIQETDFTKESDTP